ncbi:acyltransferase [Cetobacterium somerae]
MKKIKENILKILSFLLTIFYKVIFNKNEIILKKSLNLKLKIKGKTNKIKIDGICLNSLFEIKGDNNKIIIEDGNINNLKIEIKGNDNIIYIKQHRGINNSIFIVLDNKNKIIADENLGIGGARVVLAGEQKEIKIGKMVMISDNVEIWASDTHSIIDLKTNKRINSDGNIEIQDNVWIGTGAMLLKNIIISKNSVVAAKSVVTKNVPANSITAGNPSKVVNESIYWEIPRI